MSKIIQNCNFGFEIEFFGGSIKNYQIFNATKLIQKRLRELSDLYVAKMKWDTFEPRNRIKNPFGVWNSNYNPTLVKTDYFNLISDGTVFEMVGNSTACAPSMVSGEAVEIINFFLNATRKYTEDLFEIDTILRPYVHDEKWDFVDPGCIYNGGKQTHNAYTGESKYAKKKYDTTKLVSFRSAGFHIHIRPIHIKQDKVEKLFAGVYAPPHCNELIKELDKIYDSYFPECLPAELQEEEKLRITDYAKKGDYRMKFHNNLACPNGGFTTLEYRQFSVTFFLLDEKLQSKILNKFAHTVSEFIEKL